MSKLFITMLLENEVYVNEPIDPKWWWCYLLWLLLLTAAAGVALGFGSDYIDQKDNFSEVTLMSEFETEFPPMALSVPTSQNTVYVTCGNFSVAPGSTEITGDAFFAYLCPELADTCMVNDCAMADGKCVPNLAPNSTCSTTVPCPDGQSCDLNTCGCVSDTTNQCTVDDDCLRNIDNPVCQTIACVGGQCLRNTTIGMQCSTNAECLGANEFCNNACTCVSSLGSAVVYTPVTGPAFPTSDAFDFNPFGDFTFLYTQLSNLVTVKFRVSFLSNDTAVNDIQSSFFFTSPPGLPPNPAGPCTGQFTFFPSVALPQGLETTVIFGTIPFGCNYGGTNDRFVFAANNLNPAYVGPLTVFSYSFSGEVSYEPLIV